MGGGRRREGAVKEREGEEARDDCGCEASGRDLPRNENRIFTVVK